MEDQHLALSISFDVDEGAWDAAVEWLAHWTRHRAPWQEPIELSCAGVWDIGPEGHAWFETDSRRVGYRGSLLYLACALDGWLGGDSAACVIESESVYQSPVVELKMVDGSVDVTLRLHDGPATFRVARDDVRRAVTNFLEDFGDAAVARLPGLRGIAGLDWLPG